MRNRLLEIVFICAIACAQLSALTGQNTIAALNRAEATYRGIETLRADFTQTLANPMLGDPVVSTGIVFLAPPSKFAMRFTNPPGDRIVSDGTWLWLYMPSSVPDQVLRQPIPNRGAATPNLLAQFVDRPLEHYRANYVGTDTLAGNIVDVVSLVPRRDDDPFTDAEVSIDRRTGLVLRLTVSELAGQRRTILFERPQVNIRIPDAELAFSVPAGTRVITP